MSRLIATGVVADFDDMAWSIEESLVESQRGQPQAMVELPSAMVWFDRDELLAFRDGIDAALRHMDVCSRARTPGAALGVPAQRPGPRTEQA